MHDVSSALNPSRPKRRKPRSAAQTRRRMSAVQCLNLCACCSHPQRKCKSKPREATVALRWLERHAARNGPQACQTRINPMMQMDRLCTDWYIIQTMATKFIYASCKLTPCTTAPSRWLFVCVTFMSTVVALKATEQLRADMLIARLGVLGKKPSIALG